MSTSPNRTFLSIARLAAPLVAALLAASCSSGPGMGDLGPDGLAGIDLINIQLPPDLNIDLTPPVVVDGGPDLTTVVSVPDGGDLGGQMGPLDMTMDFSTGSACASTADCVAANMPPFLICDTSGDTQNLTCVACNVDSDCALGTLCMSHSCQNGCNTGRPCPAGGGICSSTTGNGVCVDCLADSDCMTTALPRCSATNKCVACLPAVAAGDGGASAVDNCPQFSACGSTDTCVVGRCKNANDCVNPPNDAGVSTPSATPVCNLPTNTCVGCMVDNDCPFGFLCDPTTAACNPGCNTNHPCPAGMGELCCNQQCISTNSDPNNCGGCGTKCGAGQTCCNSVCDVLNNSINNCGACGTVCGAVNSTPKCASRMCAIDTCNSGFQDCNRTYADGCETNINTDVGNCGGCGNACNLNNALPQCTGGNCTVASCNGTYADCNKSPTDGCEIDTSSDPANCAACGTACNLANANSVCASSTCHVGSCKSGFSDCDLDPSNGCEIQTDSDIMNCGTCGTVCNGNGGTPTCSGGVCGIVCMMGLDNCNGSAADGCETDLTSDPLHCGACTGACSNFNITIPDCSASVCDGQCDVGFADCNMDKRVDGCEVSTDTDPANCGTCGAICSGNHITTTLCAAGQCTGACDTGYADCDLDLRNTGCEINTVTDPNNCGGCSTVCSSNNVGTIDCAGSVCDGACVDGFADCNDNKQSDGCETDLHNDANNCGACGGICSNNNVPTPVCTGGVCNGACAPGTSDCNLDELKDGCEINTTNDADNCGACGAACSMTNVAIRTCGGSVCNGSCSTGFADCNGDKLSDGCEINLNTDPSNCGTCGVSCSNQNIQTVTCGAAVCNGACVVGYADCNSDKLSDGCEINLQTDIANCGACNHVCSGNNIMNPTCTFGVCGGPCAAGFADCNGNPADGCETNLNTDPDNCGTCNAKCSGQNITTRVCNGAVCISACNNGYANCDNTKLLNGCETNIASDKFNCGACSNQCSNNNISTPVCTTGTCTGACNPGYTNCNNNKLSDGCEVQTTTDPANCGACGTLCSNNNINAPSCASGNCNGQCNSGFNDCNSNLQSDGCETNIRTNPNNCAGCGLVCSNNHIPTPLCTVGSCTGTCATGFSDCDNNKLTNGCETATGTDATNCGGCNLRCSSQNMAQVTCGSGLCNGTCLSGYGDCNSNKLNDGCEVNLNTDVNNCGACAAACSTVNISPACTNTGGGATCNGVCATGFADCDSNKRSDGCEINITSDINNCGGCTIACSSTHVTPLCASSVCSGACASGFADCDNNKQTTGCEVNTQTDAANCGGCKNACSSANMQTITCAAGACNGVCNTGYADCDGNKLTNGCEINTTNDNTHCGSCTTTTTAGDCGTVCGGSSKHVLTTGCSVSACSILTCAAGFHDTNGTCTDGCECADTTNTYPPTCATVANLGNVGIGATISQTSNLVNGANSRQAWFKFTFNGDVTQVATYHPAIKLTGGNAGEFVMDVYAGDANACGANPTKLACAATDPTPANGSVARTMWETFYADKANTDPVDPGTGANHFNYMASPGSGGTIIIVVRRAAGTETCNAFTVTITS